MFGECADEEDRLTLVKGDGHEGAVRITFWFEG
jgi:hypothetical protein